jgi:hypothetical protein
MTSLLSGHFRNSNDKKYILCISYVFPCAQRASIVSKTISLLLKLLLFNKDFHQDHFYRLLFRLFFFYFHCCLYSLNDNKWMILTVNKCILANFQCVSADKRDIIVIYLLKILSLTNVWLSNKLLIFYFIRDRQIYIPYKLHYSTCIIVIWVKF